MIKLIKENKNNYIDLLLLADPDINIVNSYLNKGDLFILSEESNTISAAIVIEYSKDICELKNIATYEKFQDKGFGRKLVNYIFDYYKNKYNYIVVGTGNSSTNNIIFYKSLGFKYYKTIDNFFIDNYPDPIYEDGILCSDMIYFKKEL